MGEETSNMRLGSADADTVADVNPIGAISKTDLKKFIAYARDAFDLPVLSESVLQHSSVSIWG